MDLQLLRSKVESVYGTDPTIAAANYVWAENVVYTPKGDRVFANPAMPAVGGVAGWSVGEHGEISFETPLVGSGTAGVAPNCGPLLKACGFSETIVEETSVTYALVANPRGGDSLAHQWTDDLHRHLMLGSRGKLGVKVAEGQRPMLALMYRGLHASGSAASAPVPGDATWTGWNDVEPVSSALTTFSFGGTNMGLRQLDIDFTDNVKFADRPHQELVDLLGERKGTGNLQVTSPALGSINFEALCKANTLSTIALVHGVDAGRIVTINATAQNAMPTYGRGQDGRHTSSVGLTLNAAAPGASTEFTIVFT
jgi:hypothetical protein